MHRFALTAAAVAIGGLIAPAVAGANSANSAVMLCAKRTPSANGDRFTSLKPTSKPRTCATFDSPADFADQVDLLQIRWSTWNRSQGVGTGRLRPFQGEYNERTGKLSWPTQRVVLRAYAPKRDGRRVVFTRLRVDYDGGFRRTYKLPTK